MDLEYHQQGAYVAVFDDTKKISSAERDSPLEAAARALDVAVQEEEV